MTVSFAGQNVLVVGGAGFVGSNLVRLILEQAPRRLTVVDNFLSADPVNVADHPAVRLVSGPVTNERILRELDQDLDYAYHLACYHGNQSSIHDPLADADEAMHEYGVSLEGGAPAGTYDTVVVAVAHDAYRALDAEALGALVAPGGLLADPRDVFRDVEMRPDVGRWTL